MKKQTEKIIYISLSSFHKVKEDENVKHSAGESTIHSASL